MAGKFLIGEHAKDPLDVFVFLDLFRPTEESDGLLLNVRLVVVPKKERLGRCKSRVKSSNGAPRSP